MAKDDPKRGRHGGSSLVGGQETHLSLKANFPRFSLRFSRESDDERERGERKRREREKPFGFVSDCVRIA